MLCVRDISLLSELGTFSQQSAINIKLLRSFEPNLNREINKATIKVRWQLAINRVLVYRPHGLNEQLRIPMARLLGVLYVT